MKVRLYNTLTRKRELFRPIRKDWVGLYTCGPTVYNFAHIGNLRTYIFEDILRRTLEYSGYKVRHIMNITDVGHLTSDTDAGEDKLEKGAAREGKTVWNIARIYTNAFLADIDKLNIKRARKIIPATERIKKQIAIIAILFRKGYAYETKEAVYFDVTKFKNYTNLSRQKLSEKITAARDEVVEDPEKIHPTDFTLWFKRVGKFKHHIMHWASPWGEGFPGWHIECSAISAGELGQPFDIHAGGVDHINVHHTNEIAQSEAAFGRPLARIWMHGEFLLIDKTKMAKSGENFLTLRVLTDKRFSPLAFRYLCLTAHYRSRLNFTWESLTAAENSLRRLHEFVDELRSQEKKRSGKKKTYPKKYRDKFISPLADDLNVPTAIAMIWKIIAEYRRMPTKFDPRSLLKLLYDFDKVLGLDLKKGKKVKIPSLIKELVAAREKFRAEKNWARADEVRKKIEKAGFTVSDAPEGPRLIKMGHQN